MKGRAARSCFRDRSPAACRRANAVSLALARRPPVTPTQNKNNHSCPFLSSGGESGGCGLVTNATLQAQDYVTASALEDTLDGKGFATSAEVDAAISTATAEATAVLYLTAAYEVRDGSNGNRRCFKRAASPPPAAGGIVFECALSAASGGLQLVTMEMTCPPGFVASQASCAPATPFEYAVESFAALSVATCRARVQRNKDAAFLQFLLCSRAVARA